MVSCFCFVKTFSKLLDSFYENLKDQFQLPVYLESLLNSLLGTNWYMKGYLDFWNKSAPWLGSSVYKDHRSFLMQAQKFPN